MHPIRKMDVPAGRSRWGHSMVGPVSDQASVICKKGIFMSLWSFITSVPLTVCEDSKELNSRFRGRQPRDPPRLMTSSLRKLGMLPQMALGDAVKGEKALAGINR